MRGAIGADATRGDVVALRFLDEGGVHRELTYADLAAETLAREIQQLRAAARMLEVGKSGRAKAAEAAIDLAVQREQTQDPTARKLLAQWPDMQKAYAGDEYVVKIRDKEIRTGLTYTSLSGTKVRKVALPRFEDHGEQLRWLMLENVPGSYPYTAGVFAFKRENEDPTRMFAGEGDCFIAAGVECVSRYGSGASDTAPNAIFKDAGDGE